MKIALTFAVFFFISMRVSRRSQSKDRGAGGFRAKSSKYFLGPGISFFRELFLVPVSREGGALRAPPLSLSTGAAPDFFRPVPFPFPCTIFPRSCAVRAAPSRFSRLFKIVVNSPGLLIDTCKSRIFTAAALRIVRLRLRRYVYRAASRPGALRAPSTVAPPPSLPLQCSTAAVFRSRCTPSFFVNTGELGRSRVFACLAARFSEFSRGGTFFPPSTL